MRDDDHPHASDPARAHVIAGLESALARERTAVQEEQRRAQRWEREAVLRASTVAGALAAQVLAARRLAAAVERNLTAVAEDPVGGDEVREALRFFREVDGDPTRR